MEVVNSHASSLPPVSNPWKELMLDRSVIFLVLLSMLVQVVLVFGGAIRHRSGSRWLNFIVWVSYMGADYVATSALGAMIYYTSGERVYAIWACVVIVHLGGPDTITAYSVPDSNLWRRHCFNMFYQGSVAVYVVYVSAIQGGAVREWDLLGACCLIFIVGITKYAERALALWLASPPQIVSSVQPIHNYMKIEHALGLEIDEGIDDDEIADVDIFRRQHEDKVDQNSVEYQYIVDGEESYCEDDENENWSESIVTIRDVWEHEGEVVTDNYLLCVAHALFKMYKRRFASLRFHKAALKKTERFFMRWRFNKIQVFNMLKMELKFMYDYLFSKSSGTAFSGWGFGMRVVNICVLGLCWFLIVRGLRETEDVLRGQRSVTYILMCVAVGLEVFQLGRMMLSDWSMVWLVCVSIRQSRKLRQRWWYSYTDKLIQGVAMVVGRFRKVVRGNYWQNQIPQLCIMERCFSAVRSSSYPFIMTVARFLPFSDLIKGGYIRTVTECHIKREFIDDHLKHRILNNATQWRGKATVAEAMVEEAAAKAAWREAMAAEAAEKVGAVATVATVAAEAAAVAEAAAWAAAPAAARAAGDTYGQLSCEERLFEGMEEGMGWEHLILSWHVGTTICERLEVQSKIEDDGVERDFGFAVGMSRYFAYLLVTCPELLPVDAEKAKMEYREVFWEIMGKMGENGSVEDFCKNFRDSDMSREGSIVLRMTKSTVTESLGGSVQTRWKDWAKKWSEILVSCGMYDKCGEHGERVTVGGEFLTFMWVVMGHVGRGEEWYSPTAMKTDPRRMD